MATLYRASMRDSVRRLCPRPRSAFNGNHACSYTAFDCPPLSALLPSKIRQETWFDLSGTNGTNYHVVYNNAAHAVVRVSTMYFTSSQVMAVACRIATGLS